MANVYRVPANCTNINFTGSGNKVPSSGLISISDAADVASITIYKTYEGGFGSTPLQKINLDGTLNLLVPSRVVSMILGGTTYNVSTVDGVSVLTSVDPAIATEALLSMGFNKKKALFSLVST